MPHLIPVYSALTWPLTGEVNNTDYLLTIITLSHKDLSDFEKGHIVMARQLVQSISKLAALVGWFRLQCSHQKWSKEGKAVNQRQGHWWTWGAKAGRTHSASQRVIYGHIDTDQFAHGDLVCGLPGEHMGPGCSMGRRQASGGSVMLWAMCYCEHGVLLFSCGCYFDT